MEKKIKKNELPSNKHLFLALRSTSWNNHFTWPKMEVPAYTIYVFQLSILPSSPNFKMAFSCLSDPTIHLFPFEFANFLIIHLLFINSKNIFQCN